MRAALLTTMWRRPKVTDYVLRHYHKMQAELAADMELILLAVGSEGGVSRELAEKNNFKYLEFSNSPLNRKYNAGFLWAKAYHPQMVFFVDSDAVITKEYFKAMKVKSKSKAVVGLLDYYFLNLRTEQLGYWSGYPKGFRYGDVIGPGRCFSKRVLDKISWQIQPDVQRTKSGNDWNCRKRLLSFGIKIKGYRMAHIGCFGMDIKTDDNIYKWDKIKFAKIIDGNEVTKLLGKLGLTDTLNIGVAPRPSKLAVRPPSKPTRGGRHFRLDIPRQVFYDKGEPMRYEPGEFVLNHMIKKLGIPDKYFISPKLEKGI